LIERGNQLLILEIKSGKTIHSEFLKNLKQFKKLNPDVQNYLVYGGSQDQDHSECEEVGFGDLEKV